MDYLLHGLDQTQVIHHEAIHACLDLQQLQSKRGEETVSQLSTYLNLNNTGSVRIMSVEG